MSPCDGLDMWRRVEGCTDLQSAARRPQGDLPCDATPGIFDAGYCDCSDGIPRHYGCNVAKAPCAARCSEPIPQSKLASLPTLDSPPSKASTAEPWWRSHLPVIVVSAVTLLLLIFHHMSLPAVNERKRFHELVAAQERQRQFEYAIAR